MTAATIDPTTGEVLPTGFEDTIEIARKALGHALTELATEAARLNLGDDLPDMARVLCILRDLKQDAATVYADVEGLMLALMDDRRVEVTGLGVFEAKRRTKRTGWDHDALAVDVIDAVVTDLGEDMTPLDTYRELKAAFSIGAGKVTRLRELGLEPDEYCQETPDGWSVQLPPRDHESDVA